MAAPASVFRSSAEVALLRAALRQSLSGAPSEPLEPLCRAVNWSHVLWLGRRLRGLLLLEDGLQRTGGGLCPADVLAQLVQFRAANQLFALMRARELVLLHDLFGRLGIPVVVASGAALAERHYARPALREVGVESHYFMPGADRARAEAALAESGYDRDVDPLALSVPQRSRVLLHSRLGVGSPAATAWWNEAGTFDYNGRTLRTLSPGHWLIYWCWKNSQRLWPDFRAVTDVDALLRAIPADGWDAVFAQASALGREPALLLGLDFCHRLLGRPLPEAVATRLARRPAIRRRVDARERHLLEGEQSPPEFLAHFRARLALQPNWAHKVRCVWRHARFFLPSRKRSAASADAPDSIGRFAPTPPAVVTAMLRLAATTPADVVCDAGCGDGRVVIAAAEQFGARGFGIDLDPERIAEARATAAARGLADRVRWHCGDFLKTDVRGASVVCVYLQGFAYPAIRRKLARELPRGARIVSHDFYFPGWAPEKTVLLRSAAARVSMLYLWRLP